MKPTPYQRKVLQIMAKGVVLYAKYGLDGRVWWPYDLPFSVRSSVRAPSWTSFLKLRERGWIERLPEKPTDPWYRVSFGITEAGSKAIE